MRKRWLLVVLAAPLAIGVLTLTYARGWIADKALFVGAMIAVGAIELGTVLTLAFSGHAGRRRAKPSGEVLYKDGLITITKNEIVFHHYQLLGGSRAVAIGEVDVVRALRPTFFNGKWRLGGSGDFQTWFPTDWARFRRDTIFLAKLKKSGGYDIGFTAKDSQRVRQVLRDLALLHPVCEVCGYDLRGSTGRCPECGSEDSRMC